MWSFWAAAAVAFLIATWPTPLQLPVSDKSQHMAAFALLAGLARLAYVRTAGWKLLAWIAAFGALIELVQATDLVGRDGDPGDWIADVIAAATILGVMGVFRSLRRSEPVSA